MGRQGRRDKEPRRMSCYEWPEADQVEQVGTALQVPEGLVGRGRGLGRASGRPSQRSDGVPPIPVFRSPQKALAQEGSEHAEGYPSPPYPLPPKDNGETAGPDICLGGESHPSRQSLSLAQGGRVFRGPWEQ